MIGLSAIRQFARRWVGERFGRPFHPYVVEAIIRSGGGGLVHLARDRRSGAPVAIKSARAPRDPDERELLEREVRALREIEHPNVIRLIEAGRSSSAGLFCVLEYCGDRNVEALVQREGAQPPARVVAILAELAAALASVHERGFVHRDVSPGNLLIDRDDRLKLIDFGLAVRLDHSDAPGDRDGGFLLAGTPGFVAPEQIVDPEVRDSRTDLYGLGAVGYYLLTGRPIFEGRHPLAVLRAQLYEEPPGPGALLESAVPPELDALIASCLGKRAASRPPSARAALVTLRELEALSPWTPSSLLPTAVEKRRARGSAADRRP